jgi:hypothetical protein
MCIGVYMYDHVSVDGYIYLVLMYTFGRTGNMGALFFWSGSLTLI